MSTSHQVTKANIQQLDRLKPPRVHFDTKNSRDRASTKTTSPESSLRDGAQAFEYDRQINVSTARSLNETIAKLLTSASWGPLQDILPDHLDLIRQTSQSITLTNEFNLSHWFQTSVFTLIHVIAWRYMEDNDWLETRYWKALGTGKSGTSDFGLFVNGICRVIVEIKPSHVSP